MISGFILLYLFFQLGIGYWVSRRIRTEADYLVAGRNLGTPLISFSLFATWFGAETCIGAAGAVYANGLSGSRSDPFGYSLCLLFLGLFMAARLWKGGYTTLADLYRTRYGKNAEKLAVLILIPSSLFWGAAQLRAFGQVISSTTELPVETTTWIAFGFVIVYTLLGGLLGDIITDFVQGWVIIIGLLILVAIVLMNGQPGEWIGAMEPARLSFTAPDETLLQRMDRWAVPVLGSLVAQELISRVFAARSAGVARRASLLACGLYLVVGSIPVLLGLIGPRLLPGVEDQEQFLIELARGFLHPAVFVVFAGALISAILATIDSILLAASALFSHNIVIPLLKSPDELTKVRLARMGVLMGGLACFLIALSSDSIYELIEMASSFGTAGVLVVTVLAIWTPWGGQVAAISALVAGVITLPLAEHIFAAQAPFLVSIGAAFLAFFLAAASRAVTQGRRRLSKQSTSAL